MLATRNGSPCSPSYSWRYPFQDGNGRFSRILTTLMLLRSGYAYVPYASLESAIEENKDLYYKALRRTQTTLGMDDADWEPWVGFFFRFFIDCSS
jgi:Fic family protein